MRQWGGGIVVMCLVLMGDDVVCSQARHVEWAKAQQVIEDYSQQHHLGLEAVAPEWFSQTLPAYRLYRLASSPADTSETDPGPFLLRQDGTIVSLYRDTALLVDAAKESHVKLLADLDAVEFVRTWHLVLYGDTRELRRIEKVAGGWEGEWTLGNHRGVWMFHLDEQGRLVDVTHRAL